MLCNIGVSLSLKGSDDITGILFLALTLHIFPLLLYFCANSISATNIQVGSMRMSMKFELALLVTTSSKNCLNGQPDTKQITNLDRRRIYILLSHSFGKVCMWKLVSAACQWER